MAAKGYSLNQFWGLGRSHLSFLGVDPSRRLKAVCYQTLNVSQRNGVSGARNNAKYISDAPRFARTKTGNTKTHVGDHTIRSHTIDRRVRVNKRPDRSQRTESSEGHQPSRRGPLVAQFFLCGGRRGSRKRRRLPALQLVLDARVNQHRGGRNHR